MSRKHKYDFSGSHASGHRERVRGARYDYWAATESGKATITAQRNEAFARRLNQSGLPQERIDKIIIGRTTSKVQDFRVPSEPAAHDGRSDKTNTALLAVIVGVVLVVLGVGIGYFWASRRSREK